ncbi:MAG: hypothetical protein P1V51_17400 [Deltaproteobacteria bacterium]|nr:hypothetical protein [Deltaproteobacteria bacterium]
MSMRRPLLPALLLLALGLPPAAAVAEVVEAVPAPAPAAASEAAPEGKPKAFFSGLAATTGVSPEELTGLSRLCASELGALGVYQVIGDQDIAALLGLEARQQMLGCEDNGSCLAEIAGSLGAERVIYGDVSRYGQTVLLNLTLLDSGNAAALGRVSRKIEGADTLEPVLSVLSGALEELVAGDPRASKAPGAAAPAPAATTALRRPDPPRRHSTRKPFPGFQLRIHLRADLTGTWHFGTRQTDAGETEYTADYTRATVIPAAGVAFRYQRFELALTGGYAGGAWKVPAAEYDLSNQPTAFWVDFSFAATTVDAGTRINVGMGLGSLAGFGVQAFVDFERPLFSSKKSAFDLNGRFALAFYDLAKASEVWSPAGGVAVLAVGGAYRLTP